jgi:hypothetical protein
MQRPNHWNEKGGSMTGVTIQVKCGITFALVEGREKYN